MGSVQMFWKHFPSYMHSLNTLTKRHEFVTALGLQPAITVCQKTNMIMLSNRRALIGQRPTGATFRLATKQTHTNEMVTGKTPRNSIHKLLSANAHQTFPELLTETDSISTASKISIFNFTSFVSTLCSGNKCCTDAARRRTARQRNTDKSFVLYYFCNSLPK